MYAFNYERPATLAAAQALLASGGNALAGGQTMIAAMKQRLQQPETVVDLGGISSLTGIRKEGNAIVIGAMTRQRNLEFSDDIRTRLPLMFEALGKPSTPVAFMMPKRRRKSAE